MTAPPPIEIGTETILNEMKTLSKNILEKHLMARKFNKDKVKKWGDLIIDEIHVTISKKYPQYGLCIFFYISDKTSYVSDNRCIFYSKTDVKFVVEYHTDDFFSEIRILATKKNTGSIKDFLSNMNNSELFLSINQKISDLLEDRTYNHELFKKVIDNICFDINEILLEKKNNRPCSYHIGYINKLPLKGIYSYYKIFDLEFSPIFFTYKNDSFTCRIDLFLINN